MFDSRHTPIRYIEFVFYSTEKRNGIVPQSHREPAINLSPYLHGKIKINLSVQNKRDKKVREVHARNYVRLISESDNFKLSQKLRKRIEHIFAEAKQNHGMNRARYRGVDHLQEQLYLIASVQNLKRLVSFMNRKKMSSMMAKIRENLSLGTFLSPILSYVNHFTKIFINFSPNSLLSIFSKQKSALFLHFYNLTLSHGF